MPELTEIAALPKVSLHDHLDGAVRSETIIALRREAHLPVLVADAEELAQLILERSRAGSLPAYLSSFALIIEALQTADALERIACEYVEDLVRDGVIYAETRWAPHNHTRGNLSMREAVESVQRGIDRGIAAARASGQDIRVEQILIALRHEHHAEETAELAVQRLGHGVVGFDIAGPEAGHPLTSHRHALDYLARHCVPCTVHAGEADGIDSIRSALVDGHALRLGHGVRVTDDITVAFRLGDRIEAQLGEVATWIRDRQIALELSPTSNLHTAAIGKAGTTIADHPFDLLYQLGFAVTVNVDNRTVSATTLTRELRLLAEAFGYGISDLLGFQRNAAAAAFLPLADRLSLLARLEQHPASRAL